MNLHNAIDVFRLIGPSDGCSFHLYRFRYCLDENIAHFPSQFQMIFLVTMPMVMAMHEL